MTNENDELQPQSNESELEATPETVANVEPKAMAEAIIEAAEEEETQVDEAVTATETEEDAELASEDEDEADTEDEPEFTPKPRPPAKLERLQKLLAAAGISSRRRAEELITQGRVQVNGKVITELGTKADLGRDHIRVDGKLLQGPERLRYFVLNKPKGFVTTVKDPEGRPTVMQFFDKMKERLYPVGRLDYQSEGLLVVTNDGDLANRLTKASSGVEKTYLVKVAGQPSEAELDILRGGVSIERGKPGSAQVRTSPARIRQVRQGDNPWFEVVLIEGRNRELRKMFEEIGHFVEKIRRVGYGPLVLDQEPGGMRELDAEELEALKKAAEGKLRTPKAKELRRRNLLDSKLPTLAPKPSGRPRPSQPVDFPSEEGRAAASRPAEFRPKRVFGAGPGQGSGSVRPIRPARPAEGEFRPVAGKTFDRGASRGPAGAEDRPRRSFGATPDRSGSAQSGPGKSGVKFGSAPRPAWKKDDRPTRSPERFNANSGGEDRPRTNTPHQGSAGLGRTGAGRPFSAKPAWTKPEHHERPSFQRPLAPRRPIPIDNDDDLGPVRPPNLHIEEIQAGPSTSNFSSSRPSTSRPYSTNRSGPSSVPRSSAPRSSSPRSDSPRSGADKPFRSEGGLSRPFTTSSGKPRAGGARPSSKPGRTGSFGAGRPSGSGARGGADSRPSYGAKRTYGANSAGSSSRSSSGPAKRTYRREEGEGSFTPRPSNPARPYTPRNEGTSDFRPSAAKPYPNSASRAERKAGSDWKPKSSFGGPGKPASGSYSKPKPGGASHSSYKSKSGAPKRPGSFGKRPGGASGGKKRG
jgi:23S rRNA pseudouridine2605 synthase